MQTGKWGEGVAVKELKKIGFKIIGRRVRVGKRDEIDIVARDGVELVFVEVKTRGSEMFGRPITAVDRHKRHTLSRAAVRYLKKLKNPHVYFRFDVVEVVGDMDSDAPPVVRHVRNAFPLDRCYSLP